MNKGYDIGGKICALGYITSLNIDYDYMLFLHSKRDLDTRSQMFDPLIKSDERICELKDTMATKKTMLGIFPNYIITEEWGWRYNKKYHNDILTLLNVKDRYSTFAGGNCMMLRKSVLDRIFTNRLQLFYNILNTKESFDLNWFLFKHGLDDSIPAQAVHALFSSSKDRIGNNMPVHKTSSQFPDGMIEHAFERIWINVINEMGGEYLVVT
jgi:hypothetical protein